MQLLFMVVVPFIQKQSRICCYQASKRIKKNQIFFYCVDCYGFIFEVACSRSFKSAKNSYNKMTQAIYQRDDLSFESPSSEEDDHIFVDQCLNKRVIDIRKPPSHANQGQVIMKKNYYYRPQRKRAERFSQTIGYDWLLLYRLNAQLTKTRRLRQMSKNKKITYREKFMYSPTQKQMQSISQTKTQVINNRFMVHVGTQNKQSDINQIVNNMKHSQQRKFCQLDNKERNRQKNNLIEVNQNSNRQEWFQIKQETTQLIKNQYLQEEKRSQQSHHRNQEVKKISPQSPKLQDWQCEFEVINLRLPTKIKKTAKKQKKVVETIIISNNQYQDQENQFKNNLSHCKSQLDETLNKAFLFGQSWLNEEEELSQGYATADLTIKYTGPIRVLKIKSFSLILGDQQVRIKLGRSHLNQNYVCCEQKYKNSLQIVQNVFEGKRQYTSSFTYANFKLFLLRLPAKLQSFFEVGLEDLSQLKLEINMVGITCFCKHKFSTYISLNVTLSVTCEKCSLGSTMVVDEYSIK